MAIGYCFSGWGWAAIVGNINPCMRHRGSFAGFKEAII